MMVFDLVDYVVLGLCLLVILVLGMCQAVLGCRLRTVRGYLTGSRAVSVLPTGISMLACYVTSITVMGDAADVYGYGVTHVFYLVSLIMACIISALTFVPLFHPLKLFSANQYLAMRYKSVLVVMLACFLQLSLLLAYNGVLLHGPAMLLEQATGIPVLHTIIATGALATLYTKLGGVKAVIWTSVFQMLVIFSTILIIVIQGTMISGGVVNVWTVYTEAGRDTIVVHPSPLEHQSVWSVGLMMTFTFLCMYGVSQPTVQRMSSVRTTADARKSMLVVAAVSLLLGLLTCLAGLVICSYFYIQGCDPYTSGHITDVHRILYYFVMTVINYPGIPGLFLSCLLCGVLSTLSSSINSCTALIWGDFLNRHLSRVPDTSKTSMNMVINFIFGCITIGLGVTSYKVGGTFKDVAFVITSSVMPPLLCMFTLGAMFPRINSKSVMLSALVALASGLFFSKGAVLFPVEMPSLPGIMLNCTSQQEYNGAAHPGSVFQYIVADVVTDTSKLTQRHQKTPSINSLTNTHTANATASPPTLIFSSHYFTSEQPIIDTDPTYLKILKVMFRISPHWTLPISVALGSLVGMLASILPGFHTVERIHHRLLFPFVRRIVLGKRTKDYQAVQFVDADPIEKLWATPKMPRTGDI